MEIRLFLARTVQRYDVAFAAGYDSDSFELSVKDFSTMQKGPIDIIMTLSQ
jgi:hypothetical protein